MRPVLEINSGKGGAGPCLQGVLLGTKWDPRLAVVDAEYSRGTETRSRNKVGGPLRDTRS